MWSYTAGDRDYDQLHAWVDEFREYPGIHARMQAHRHQFGG